MPDRLEAKYFEFTVQILPPPPLDFKFCIRPTEFIRPTELF